MRNVQEIPSKIPSRKMVRCYQVPSTMLNFSLKNLRFLDVKICDYHSHLFDSLAFFQCVSILSRTQNVY